MRIAILTNEYPPNVYGGAGVHVEYLAKELVRADQGRHSVKVLCFGAQHVRKPRLSVQGVGYRHKIIGKHPGQAILFDTFIKDIVMAGELKGVDIIHCHTWYSHLAGLLAKQLLGVPLVLTTHSLEPHRPWKAEQLGSGYRASSWIEATAYKNSDGVIAVSSAMKQDVHALYGVPRGKISVIHNGIDIAQYKFTADKSILAKYNIAADRPFILFVGRITRQKGIIHLVNAVKYIRPGCQVVLCAGAPDTPQIAKEMAGRVAQARKDSKNRIVWIPEILPKAELIPLYSQAFVFVCPSVYEPFGIINLEAMACRTPVVAAAVGGIPEVVVPGKTGLLVRFKPKGAQDAEPADPEKFARDLAAAVNSLLAAPQKVQAMRVASRRRAEQHFSWSAIASQTIDFYKETRAIYDKIRL